ncbi:proline-rich protein 18-like [Gadus macrocephalus]|uniref:proline-rich protein 18-like n=1 Tax=Gadus macrocephalus TaxID=80720 RepID=UPI0028CB3B59|nr:proline-rich protein 18-like [Gadus macrocephalus]
MEVDTSNWPALLRSTVSCFMRASIFSIECFECMTELFSYLILCVAKMPFIPLAASIGHPRSACGPGPGGENMQTKRLSLPASAFNKSKASVDEKCISVKERPALNLRNSGRKSQPKSRVPTAKVVAAPGLNVKSSDQRLSSSTLPSGVSHHTPSKAVEAASKIPLYSHKRRDASSMKRDLHVNHSAVCQKESGFTLMLTPEAVHLLQRRSAERKQRTTLTANSTAAGAEAMNKASKSGRNRQSPSMRHVLLAPQCASPSSRLNIITNSKEAALGDISSIEKTSPLNERHKYDDVEHEEEGDCGVEELVVLKCMEWLRGLENAVVTLGNSTSKGTERLQPNL